MNVLISIDSFKGSLTTNELSDAIEQGIREVSSDFVVKKIPIADGGEGTYKTLVDGLGGTTISLHVKGPLFEDVIAEYGILQDNTAIIEMAQSSGLPMVPINLRNPLNTSTFGVGEMINDAINRGCRTFIIGIGGSATNDGGIGMLAAMGYQFMDKDSNVLTPIGSSLNNISYIDYSNVRKELKECKFLIACDVDNPFYGPRGAANVYAKQKGATPEQIITLDQGLQNFATVIERELKIDVAHLQGSGAAGGLGGGFRAFLGGELRPGIEIIFEKLDLIHNIEWADIIITGEGRLDFQTVMGKAPIGVAKLAKEHNKIVIALAGNVQDDAISAHDHGITSMFSIIDSPMSLDEAMDTKNAKRLVKKSVKEIFNLINALK